MFTDDMELSIEYEVMNISDAPSQCVIDRNHGQISDIFANRQKSSLKRDTGNSFKFGVGFAAGKVRISAGHSLKSYFSIFFVSHVIDDVGKIPKRGEKSSFLVLLAMICKVLQVGVVGATAAAKYLYPELAVEPEHIVTPMLQVILMQDGGSIQLTMVQ